ncbi:MAG: DNA-processing protein DprA [Actinomycetes bacterium]
MITELGRRVLPFTLTPGLGPVLTARLIEWCGGDLDRAASASASMLRQVPGFGPARADSIAAGLAAAGERALRAIDLAERLGVRIVAKGDESYPELMAILPDAPWVIYVRGAIEATARDRYPVAIVGSRKCTAYGLEQARTFGAALARAGLTVVSGGARGVDSAAHRGVLASGGRTIAVLGCGLAHCYPPENRDIFDAIASQGAVVSELPLDTTPHADQFPARNRIISGLSLGVVVIEADERSGALITARVAAEEHGREVMALPGRVDSASSRGTHALIKAGGASLVSDPADVLAQLEGPARHLHASTHAARFQPASSEMGGRLGAALRTETGEALPLTELQRRVWDQLGGGGMTLDELWEATGLDTGVLRRELMALELARRVRREGHRFAAVAE